MSVFHEVSLPLPFALGASGGPERRVDIVALASGLEVRNTPWAHGRRRYDVGGAVRSIDELHELIAFFEARRGRLHGFRLRDPFDHKSCAPSEVISALDQTIGVGDGVVTSFQLSKAYALGVGAYVRPIQKPIAATVRVAVSGVSLSSGQFSVNAASGQISLSTPPSAAAAVTAGFEFDTPVRFDADGLEFALEGFGAGRALSVPLVEIAL